MRFRRTIRILALLILTLSPLALRASEASEHELKAGYCFGTMKPVQQLLTQACNGNAVTEKILRECNQFKDRFERLNSYVLSKGISKSGSTEELLPLITAIKQGEEDFHKCSFENPNITSEKALACADRCNGGQNEEYVLCTETCLDTKYTPSCRAIREAKCDKFTPY
jgi:hypothetical protein